MLAYDYPLLGAFWTMLVFFLWVAWLFLLFRVIFDIFRDRELSGWLKAIWLIVILFLPFLGVLVYVIARGPGMADRDMQRAQASEQAFQSYVRETAAGASGGVPDQLTKLAALRDSGVITDAEFEQQKAKLLA